MFYLKHAFSTYLSFLMFIFIKIEESIDSMKIIMNTFSPIKELIIASEAKTITSAKHKLICPTANKKFVAPPSEKLKPFVSINIFSPKPVFIAINPIIILILLISLLFKKSSISFSSCDNDIYVDFLLCPLNVGTIKKYLSFSFQQFFQRNQSLYT